MIEFLDGQDLYNTIRLLLEGGSPRVLVVEGIEDWDLLVDFVEELPVELHAGYGKPTSLGAAVLAEADNAPVRFMFDADFDRLTGSASAYPSTAFVTDLYDLTVDIAHRSPQILRRIARVNRVDSTGPAPDAQVALAYETAAEIGAVRFSSEVKAWSLNMAKFPSHLCLPSSANGVVDVERLISLAVSRTESCLVALEVVRLEVPTLVRDIDRIRLVNGHDLLDALQHVSRSLAGGKSGLTYFHQFLLSVGADELRAVPVVQQIEEWVTAA